MNAADRLAIAQRGQPPGRNAAVANGVSAQEARLGRDPSAQTGVARQTSPIGAVTELNRRPKIDPPAQTNLALANIFEGAAAELNKRPTIDPPAQNSAGQTSIFEGAAAEPNRRRRTDPPTQTPEPQHTIAVETATEPQRTDRPNALPPRAAPQNAAISDAVGDPRLRAPGAQPAVHQSGAFAHAAANLVTQVKQRKPAPRTLPPPPQPERVTLLVSVENGKIGSIYNATGRIRLSHEDGPKMISHADKAIIRYNINYESAVEEFKSRSKDELKQAFKSIPWHSIGAARRDRKDEITSHMASNWISKTLYEADTLPDWAMSLGEVKDIPEIDDIAQDSNLHLFEVFIYPDNTTRGHISRGQAVAMKFEQKTLDVIDRAFEQIDRNQPPEVQNAVLNAYIKANAPEIANRLRTE